jgi:hypothetical protein
MLHGLSNISVSFAPIWRVFTSGKHNTFREYWQAFKSTYAGNGEPLHFAKAALWQNTIDYNLAPRCEIKDCKNVGLRIKVG